MYRTDTRNLFQEVSRGYSQLKEAKNSEERVALANYIGNLYTEIAAVQDQDVFISRKTVFGSHRNYHKFIKKLDIYEMKMLENFVLQKDFHRDYLSKIYAGIKDNFDYVGYSDTSKHTIITMDECYAIFSEFMKSINQEELFNKFYKEGRIYRTISDDDSNLLGVTEVNPISGETNIFVGDFNYSVDSMTTLAHEFGHAYDYSKFNGSIEEFNKYRFQSFYNEVFSKLFERLFLQYLIKNNILVNDAKEASLRNEEINKEYILGSYILSLLDDQYLLANSYPHICRARLLELVGNNFSQEDDIENFILNSTYFDVSEDYRYAYGDIISMFLKIQIDNYGFDNDLIREVFSFRSDMFDKSIIDKYNFNPNRYKILHRKEIKKTKK